MKVLITGGAGFLGSHLVDSYLADGHDVIVVDHHLRQKRRWPNPKATVHPLRFSDPAVKSILLSERPDAVIHLAAQISVTKSIDNPLLDIEMNLIEAAELLEHSQAAGVKKFVFASSGGAIYGDNPVIPTPLIKDATPLSPYGINKLGFEWLIEYFGKKYNLNYTIIRFSNLFGPRQQVMKPMGEGNVISLFLDRLLVTGEPITVFGDGESLRDYLFADDAVAVVRGAVESNFSGIVNAGTGQGTSVNQLVAELKNLHGSLPPVVYLPYRPGEVVKSIIDYSSATESLGWHPVVDFKSGLKQTYDWYKQEFGA